jgi:hypothetical protein
MNDTATEGSSSSSPASDSPTPGGPIPGSPIPGSPGAPPEGSVAANGAENGHLTAPALMREAISLIKEHPLGAVATVAAATALIEIEFAVGVLAGLGATALLAHQSGPEARQRVLERGKWALDRARTAIQTRSERLAAKKAPPAEAPPPAA